MEENCNLGHTNYDKTIVKSHKQRREILLLEKMEEVGRGCFEGKSFGQK